MRYAASEKLEIIRLVEESHLSARRTLAKLGIPRTTFYRWYDRYLQRGEAGLQDQSPKPAHVWNRVPTEVKRKVVDLALQETELSPRELAVTFTDQERYFVSESTVYRTLKAHDLITSPAFIVLKAADEFQHKTAAINQLWQTDFTYLKVIGWGWFYLSTVLDDYSRYIIAWKLCTNMRAEDVTDTLDLALQASGCDQVHVVHKPRLLSDNGSSYVSGDLAEWLEALTWCARPSANPGQDRALAPNPQEPHLAGKLLPARRSRGAGRGLRRSLQSPAISREPQQRHTCRRLLRPGQSHSQTTRKDQTKNTRSAPLASPQTRRIIKPTR